jgi:hypothetical protein
MSEEWVLVGGADLELADHLLNDEVLRRVAVAEAGASWRIRAAELRGARTARPGASPLSRSLAGWTFAVIIFCSASNGRSGGRRDRWQSSGAWETDTRYGIETIPRVVLVRSHSRPAHDGVSSATAERYGLITGARAAPKRPELRPLANRAVLSFATSSASTRTMTVLAEQSGAVGVASATASGRRSPRSGPR